MYISEIIIDNFRNFKGSNRIEFNEGVNVLIGHNNSGKSNLIKALGLVLSFDSSKRLDVDDFNKNTTIEELKKEPPRVTISVTFYESKNEAEISEDIVTASQWLTDITTPYKAQLTYVFYLSERDRAEYAEAVSLISSAAIDDYWRMIKHSFLRKYKSRIYGGNPDYKVVADTGSLKQIDFQFLDAIRDVERDLFTGKNTLLREVIDFFMDYDIKNRQTDKHKQLSEINELKQAFSSEASKLIDNLKKRMESGKKEMLGYASDTGASFGNAEPDFEGYILDTELYSALKLIVKYETGISIPATHNGLGYNNLIYVSLLLAKMQKDASGEYLGSNAKVFPVLAIEEPEAHLHPAMQYKFLKFLKKNSGKKARQIFITTHSPNITSAVSLDEIICFHRKGDGSLNIGYVGRVFDDNSEDKKSKAYVERFLDVTKSDMLFARSIILVEGITEQLVMALLAQHEGYDLENNHVSVINVGGRYFEHFLKLFDSNRKHSIHKKVVCISDPDPVRKETTESQYKSCYPFEIGLDSSRYDYKSCSNAVVNIYGVDCINNNKHPNIVCFPQNKQWAKTFEYALVYANPGSKILITDSISNSEELSGLFEAYAEGKDFAALQGMLSTKAKEVTRIIEGLQKYEGTDKKEHLLAARYLDSVQKGENAYELAKALEELLMEENAQKLKVPDYIRNSIKWICK
jgi:predicted ATP-dependent endonuclease of OLD family